MHTAVTDLNPDFASGLLMAFLSEEDVLRNGYDQARGPCGNKKKWVVAGDSQAFISTDDISCVDVDLLRASGEDDEDDESLVGEYWDEPATANDGSHRKVDEQEVTAWLHARYPTYMEPGMKSHKNGKKPAKAVPRVSDYTDHEIANFNEFPGKIGAHKLVELRHPKVCQVKLLCGARDCESHGKRGRKKVKQIPIFIGVDRHWRQHALEFLETY